MVLLSRALQHALRHGMPTQKTKNDMPCVQLHCCLFCLRQQISFGQLILQIERCRAPAWLCAEVHMPRRSLSAREEPAASVLYCRLTSSQSLLLLSGRQLTACSPSSRPILLLRCRYAQQVMLSATGVHNISTVAAGLWSSGMV